MASIGTGPNGESAKRHPLRAVWRSMRDRCSRSKHRSYGLYGGAGIAVCERWQKSFWSFVADVGARPSPAHSLDRIDGSRGYEPGNVRWATQAEQLRNQKRNRRITFRGKTLCLSDWASETGINKCALRARICVLGWSTERALTTPVRATRRHSN